MKIEALVVGATGIAGRGISQELLAIGARVHGLSRLGTESCRASSMWRPTSWIPQSVGKAVRGSSPATSI